MVPLLPGTKSLPPRDTHVNYGTISNKKKTIDRWFHPESGRFAGYNIGLACGLEGGVFAIDIDATTKSGASGFESLAELEAEYSALPTGPIARTPSGGEHRLFKWEPMAASSTSKIAAGIDTRGGTESASKGHIVVFPSIVDGVMYKWEQGGEEPELPDWVRERMGFSVKLARNAPNVPKMEVRGNENVQDADFEQIVPISQIQTMLDYINPDDLSYDKWLRVGQAIHSQYPNQEGLRLWDDWSRNGERYKSNECGVRWSGFDEGGNIRIGTIFYLAKMGGWNKAPDDANTDSWNDIIEGMNETFAIVMVGGKIRVLKERETPDPMLGYYEILHKEDFRTLCGNKLHAILNPATGKAAMRNEADIWLAHANRRTYEHGMAMFPGGGPPGWYNTWCGWAVSPDESGCCDMYLEHLRDIICGSEEIYEWVLDWMADGIQDPGNPKGSAIVMRGKEGTGKGTFADTYGQMYGAHYRHLIDDHHLVGNFNAHLMDALLVFADEITWGGNKKSAGKLKGLVTERYIMGERKGVDAVTIRNMIRLIIASNEDWVIPAGPQSRRWLVLNVSDARKNDKVYFAAIRKQMREGGIAKLMHVLMNREITSDLSVAPHTLALEEQRSLHQSFIPTVQWWLEKIQSRSISIPDEDSSYDSQPKWATVVNRDALFGDYLDYCEAMGVKPEYKTAWERRLTTYGCSAKRVGGENRQWVLYIPSWGRAVVNFRQEAGITVVFESGESNEQP